MRGSCVGQLLKSGQLGVTLPAFDDAIYQPTLATPAPLEASASQKSTERNDPSTARQRALRLLLSARHLTYATLRTPPTRWNGLKSFRGRGMAPFALHGDTRGPLRKALVLPAPRDASIADTARD